jgi:hypothetical protein
LWLTIPPIIERFSMGVRMGAFGDSYGPQMTAL